MKMLDSNPQKKELFARIQINFALCNDMGGDLGKKKETYGC